MHAFHGQGTAFCFGGYVLSSAEGRLLAVLGIMQCWDSNPAFLCRVWRSYLLCHLFSLRPDWIGSWFACLLGIPLENMKEMAGAGAKGFDSLNFTRAQQNKSHG